MFVTGEDGMIRYLALWLALATLAAKQVDAQLVPCTRDSPERQGKPGCTIVSDKRLPSPPPPPVLWHIDEFSSSAQAQQAESPWSLAIEAYGRAGPTSMSRASAAVASAFFAFGLHTPRTSASRTPMNDWICKRALRPLPMHTASN